MKPMQRQIQKCYKKNQIIHTSNQKDKEITEQQEPKETYGK